MTTVDSSPRAAVSAEKARPSRLRRYGENLLWVAAAVGLYWWMRPTPSGPEVGELLPTLQLIDPATKETKELAPTGRPRLIEVFASWCGACRKSNGLLREVGPDSLDFVMVSVDDTPLQAVAAKRSWPIEAPVLFDARGRLPREWNVNMFPTFILLDGEGRVARISNGIPGAFDLHAFSEAARESARSN